MSNRDHSLRIDELKARERELLQELEEYSKEKDRLKAILGNIGGKSFSKRDNIINIIFLVVVLGLFLMEILFKLIPIFVSLEISVLLVSIKIVFMIHSQHKVNHFQFWILNSIEYRVNDINDKVTALQCEIHGKSKTKR